LVRPRTATTALRAFSKSSATSISSGVDKDATLAQRSLDQRPSDTGPTPSELPIDDHHVDRRQHVAELTSQTNGFASCVPHVGFDHERWPSLSGRDGDCAADARRATQSRIGGEQIAVQ
jgi:hypothetical protein